MDEELKNLKFSTKSVLLTKRQKETIENLIDQLMDYDCYDYEDLEYWKLSKQDASTLISELIDKVDVLSEDCYFDNYDHFWKDDD